MIQKYSKNNLDDSKLEDTNELEEKEEILDFWPKEKLYTNFKKIRNYRICKGFGRNIAAKKLNLAGSNITYLMKMEDELKNQKK